MTFDEAKEAVEEAQRTMRAVRSQAKNMAAMLAEIDLSKADCWNGDLAKLKRQLSKYNIHTSSWRK